MAGARIIGAEKSRAGEGHFSSFPHEYAKVETVCSYPVQIRRRAVGFAIFYVIAIIVLILHFTGWLRNHNLEWIIYILAVLVFPAVLYL